MAQPRYGRHGLQATGLPLQYYCSILTARAGRQDCKRTRGAAQVAVSEASLACASVQMIACIARQACGGGDSELGRSRWLLGGWRMNDMTIDETHEPRL